MSPSHINADWSGDATPQHGNALAMLHRLLRGRMLITAALAAVCGVVGGVTGFLAQAPLFESKSIIKIQPVLPKILYETEQSTAPRMFASFVSTQAELISSARVLERAMESDKWRAVAMVSGVTTVDGFNSHLRVKTTKSAQELIYITFEDEDARVAQAGNQAVVEAYMELYGNESDRESKMIMSVLLSQRESLRKDKQVVDQSIQNIAAQWGTDQLDQLMRSTLETVTALSDGKQDLDSKIAELQRLAQATDDATIASSLTEDRAAQLDPGIGELVALRRSLETSKAKLISDGVLPGHRQYRQIEAGLAQVNNQIADRVAELRKAILAGQASVAGGTGLSVDELVAQRDAVEERLRDARKRQSELGKANLDLRDLFSQREDIEKDITRTEDRITALRTESQVQTFSDVSGKISVASPAQLPKDPSSDKRIKMAAAGFVGGGALPVVAMLGIGLMGRRVRFSDDDILDSAHSRIVGVLPDLGKSITDRELAEASAFAVHQIRSQLQILYGRDKTAVFAVTSPAPGDGKTSMIIALGLSFAESGDRTLLIDLDLIGRGLSLHFGHPNAASLAEAANSGGDLPAMVQKTSFERLSVLPAGFGDEHRISRLSPAVVRRIVESFRDRYDTVLIDSGPILGSIEAGLLAPAVDGMLMVVGRGQLRPLVKRAVDQITAVGGQVVATVFNRASLVELRQSTSSLSVHFSRQASRQAAEQARSAGPRVGPLAGSLFTARSGPDEQDGTQP